MRSSTSLNTITITEQNTGDIIKSYLALQTFVDLKALEQEEENPFRAVNLGNIDVAILQLRQRLESCSILAQYRWLREEQCLRFNVQQKLSTPIDSSIILTISSSTKEHELTIVFRHLIEKPYIFAWQLVDEREHQHSSNGRKLVQNSVPNN